VATWTWDGFDENLMDIDGLPTDLGAAGGLLAMEAAQQAATAIAAAYPRGPERTQRKTREGRTLISFTARGATMAGPHVHLQDGIIVRDKVLPYGARSKVVNVAPHAAEFEYGRQAGRHGTTPARPTFIPIRETYQRGLVDALRELMESRGLVVSGEAGQ
jgi:hypothetical protein